jgi:hypothetical protein
MTINVLPVSLPPWPRRAHSINTLLQVLTEPRLPNQYVPHRPTPRQAGFLGAPEIGWRFLAALLAAGISPDLPVRASRPRLACYPYKMLLLQ